MILSGCSLDSLLRGSDHRFCSAEKLVSRQVIGVSANASLAWMNRPAAAAADAAAPFVRAGANGLWPAAQ